jgi:hypothetical protein
LLFRNNQPAYSDFIYINWYPPHDITSGRTRMSTPKNFKSKVQRLTPLLAALLIAPGIVSAAIPLIPTENGFGGFVVAGLGYTDMESNVVAGNKWIDIGKENLNSLTASPPSDDTAHFQGTGELRWTFGDQWQVFLGNNLIDQVTLDFSQQLGMRKQTDNIGSFSAGLLFSGVPSEVWQDPYQTNASGFERRKTNRDSGGIRLEWDRIFGTGADVTLSFRDIDIDKEQIGQNDVATTGCNATCQNDLRRDGDSVQLELAWLFELSSRHSIRPAVRFNDNDRDGNAQDNDGYSVSLAYSLLSDDWRLVLTGLYFDTEFDNVNPIYGIKQDSDGYALTANFFYDLTSDKRWQITGNVSYGDSDSDIDFHDNTLFNIGTGVVFNWGARGSR